MEEKKNNVEINVKTKRRKAKIAVISLCTIVVLFLALQVYASTNGYGNVFFMIKNLITTGTLSGEEEIFSDKDITLSYKSIELADGLKLQANRLEIKDGKTKLYLLIKSQDGEPLPLKYAVTTKNSEGTEVTTTTNITGTKPQDTDSFSYEDILHLNYEVDESKIITLKINSSSDKELRTIEINLATREITVKGEASVEKISKIELRKYLNMFSELNNGNKESDILLYIAQKIQNNGSDLIEKQDLEQAKNSLTDRAFKNSIIKEFFGDKAEFEFINNPNLGAKGENGPDVEVLKGITAWEFDKENDEYKALTEGSEYRHGHCLKIEDISYENGIYTVKYIYILATGYEEDDEKLEDLPQYETTIKLKRDNAQIYSKYQIVSIEEGKEIKDKVSTKIDESNIEDDIWEEDSNENNQNDSYDFFKENSKLDYKDDLTNSENGKIAIAKAGEEDLKTTQNNGYYTYTDMWNNSYNIKKIKDVKSEFSQLGKDKKSALFKCTIYYIDNNNRDKSFDVAVIVSKEELEGGVIGTFDSYTGSTSFTRWAGLYEKTEEQQLEPDNYVEDVIKDEIKQKVLEY